MLISMKQGRSKTIETYLPDLICVYIIDKHCALCKSSKYCEHIYKNFDSIDLLKWINDEFAQYITLKYLYTVVNRHKNEITKNLPDDLTRFSRLTSFSLVLREFIHQR